MVWFNLKRKNKKNYVAHSESAATIEAISDIGVTAVIEPSSTSFSTSAQNPYCCKWSGELPTCKNIPKLSKIVLKLINF